MELDLSFSQPEQSFLLGIVSENTKTRGVCVTHTVGLAIFTLKKVYS
jgi:hypothetical protein